MNSKTQLGFGGFLQGEAMASKKYHVDGSGKVSECRATFRSCPYEDFQTREGALTAHELKKQKTDLDQRREYLNKLFNSPDTVRSIGRFSMTGNKLGKRVRDYAHALDNSYTMNGKDADLYYSSIDLEQENPKDKKMNFVVNRRTFPNTTEGIENVTWVLQMNPVSIYGKKQELEINFDEDPAKAEREARVFFEEGVRLNGVDGVHSINDEADKLYGQFKDAYIIVEEEARGPYYVWDNYGWNEGLGNFAESDTIEINANVDYSSSTLRPRSVERFLNENKDYQVGMPEINLRIYDNEGGNSDAWWAASYNNGDWKIEFLQDGHTEPRTAYLNNPEEAQSLMNSFVKGNMRTNDDWTANEKSEYVANFMIEMDRISRNAQEQNAEFAEVVSNSGNSPQSANTQSKHKNRMDDKIFGSTDKNSTMGKILGIFG